MVTRHGVIGCLLMAAAGSAGSGCIVEEHHHPIPQVGGNAPPQSPAEPPSYRIDTNAQVTLMTGPGDGAAAMISYFAGGRWDVQTLCDTNRSGIPCEFGIYGQATSGTVTNVTGLQLEPGDSATYYDSSTALLTATTTGDADEMSFDTTPGTPVLFTMYLDGVLDPQYLFFVSGGNVVSQGYQADPVYLTPTTP